LREEWERERVGVDALLEYCGKSVKFGSGKVGGVEVPEWE
jgi:hypothetical protein